MTEAVMRFIYSEEGVATVEYALAGALITATLVGAFTLLAVSVNNTFFAIDAVLPG